MDLKTKDGVMLAPGVFTPSIGWKSDYKYIRNNNGMLAHQNTVHSYTLLLSTQHDRKKNSIQEGGGVPSPKL